MIKRILLALALLALAATPTLAQTGSPKTKANMNAEIGTQFPDNSTGAITPAILRQVTLDMVASWQQYAGVSAQTAANYTVQLSDYGQLVTVTNASPVAVTLPQATSSFATFSFFIKNVGSTTATVTPVTSTINGAASLTVPAGAAYYIVSDGANWQAVSFGFIPNPLIVPQIIGGTAANATLTLQSTNNGSPSGDAVILAGSKVLYGATVAQGMGATGGINPTWQTYGAGATASFALIRETNPGAGGALVVMGASRGTPHSGVYSALQSGDGIGSLIGVGDTGSNLNAQGGAVAIQADGNWTPTSAPGALIFSTTPAGLTNFLERMRITSGGLVGIGQTSTPIVPDSLLTVNANTAASVAPPAGTIVHMVGPDNLNAGFLLDSYGVAGGFGARRANTGLASKSNILNGQAIATFNSLGWDGTGYGQGAFIQLTTTEDWTTINNHGSAIKLWTTPTGSSSFAEVMRIQPSGGLSVGSANVATDPGNGNIRATGATFSGITGSNQCVQISTTGVLSGAGAACGVSSAPNLLPLVNTWTEVNNFTKASQNAVTITASNPGGNNGLTIQNTDPNGTGNASILFYTDTALSTLSLTGGFFQEGFAGTQFGGTNSMNLATIGAYPLGLSTNSTLRIYIGPTNGGVVIGNDKTLDPASGVLLAKTALQTTPTTVGALQTCNAANEGMRQYVTDQNTAVAYRGATSGGGSTRQAVLCSNSAWIQN